MSVNLNRQSVFLEDIDMKGGKVEEAPYSQAEAFEAAQRSEGWKDAIKSSPKALLWCQCNLRYQLL
jgi:hypothetical protein